MDDFIQCEHFQQEDRPALLGFVLDVSRTNLQVVKKQLINVASNSEMDERIYTYHPCYNDLPRWPGIAVAMISNYRHLENINLMPALEKVVAIMSGEDSDIERNVFVISDRNKINFRMLRMAEEAWNPVVINYHLFSIVSCEILPNVHHEVVGVSSLAEKIRSTYKKKQRPFFLDNYEPLNIEELRGEYGKSKNDEVEF